MKILDHEPTDNEKFISEAMKKYDQRLTSHAGHATKNDSATPATISRPMETVMGSEQTFKAFIPRSLKSPQPPFPIIPPRSAASQVPPPPVTIPRTPMGLYDCLVLLLFTMGVVSLSMAWSAGWHVDQAGKHSDGYFLVTMLLSLTWAAAGLWLWSVRHDTTNHAARDSGPVTPRALLRHSPQVILKKSDIGDPG